MENIQFEKECNEILDANNYVTTEFIKAVLNKDGKNLEKPTSEIKIMAYILPKLLNYGCIIRTTTQEIADACKCSTRHVNKVLGFVGFKYERDKVTHKDENESKGLFERYYQFEYTETGATKRTSSVFNIVATQKLFDLLSDELDLVIRVDEEELAKLHADSKAKAYTKSVKRETVVITYTKETTVFTTSMGTTTSVNYTGVDSAINELQSLQTVEEPTDEDLLSEFSNEELMEIANRQYPLEERIINTEFEDEMPTNETMEENVQDTPSTVEMEDVFDDIEPAEVTFKKPIVRRRNTSYGFSAEPVEDIDLDDEFIPNELHTRTQRKQIIQEDSKKDRGFGFSSSLGRRSLRHHS